MVQELSSKEQRRRESILRREFVNTTLSNQLRLKTIESLRNMPTASLLEPIGEKITAEEKQELYDILTTSSFYRGQNEIVRAWLQLRLQDILERGHLPSSVEIICLKEIYGKELASSIIIKAMEILENLNLEIRQYVVSPKSEIEELIFSAFKDKA